MQKTIEMTEIALSILRTASGCQDERNRIAMLESAKEWLTKAHNSISTEFSEDKHGEE